MQMYATKIAQATPPRNPSTLEYTPLFLAQSLMQRKVSLKFLLSGTSYKIISVTRQPLSDLMVSLSQFLSTLSSRRCENSSPTSLYSTLPNSRSISTPSNFILITGTKASSTSEKSVTPGVALKIGASSSKKCFLRSIFLGATQRVSISEFGLLTPSL